MKCKNKGSVLIVTLFIVFLLSVIALSLAYSTRLRMNLLKRRIERVKSYYIARGALFLVFEELEKDRSVSESDSFNEDWFLKFSDGRKVRCLDFYSSAGDKRGSYKVFISDEESKININTASVDTLDKLLSNFKGVDSRRMAEEIVSYRNNKKPLDKFYTVHELLAIKDMSNNVFFGEDRNDDVILYPRGIDRDNILSLYEGQSALELGLKDLVTVYTQGRVNINTASFLVLSSMPGMSPRLAKSLIDERKNKPFESLEDVKKIAGISENVYTDISKWAVVKSDCFRILIAARADNKITRHILVIADRSRDYCKIRYWRQD